MMTNEKSIDNRSGADAAPNYSQLVRSAFEARKNAYAPYSRFMVGAALLTKEGEVYAGCNIENAAYSPTNCAERTAFFHAVSKGLRQFRAIAVVGGMEGVNDGEFEYVFPCGVCRQVMAEFCAGDFVILTAKSPSDYQLHTLQDLLPEAFGPGNLL